MSFSWMPSIAGAGSTSSICGFATYVLPLHRAIIQSNLFNLTPNQDFVDEYMHALAFNITHQSEADELQSIEAACGYDPVAIQAKCAYALKCAFAHMIVREMDDNINPIFNMLGITLGHRLAEATDAETTNLNDYLDFTNAFYSEIENLAEFEEIRTQYDTHLRFNQKLQAGELDNALQDGASFVRFMLEHYPATITKIKDTYCAWLSDPNNNYEAQDFDMAYMARLLGVRNLHIHRGEMDNTYSTNWPLNDAGQDFHIHNPVATNAEGVCLGGHWMGCELPIPAINPHFLHFSREAAEILAQAVDGKLGNEEIGELKILFEDAERAAKVPNPII